MSVTVNNNCLEGVIGLSRTECECYDVPANESLSGLYLDELDGLNLSAIKAGANCEDGSIWDMMSKALESAIFDLSADLEAEVRKNFKVTKEPWQGIIGRDSIRATEVISNYAGVKILCAPVKSGVLRIKRIGTMFSGVGNLTLSVYNNIQDAAVATLSVPTLNSDRVQWYTLPTPLELPMYDAQKEYVQYYFVYDNPGYNPKNNNFKCCSFNPSYNCHSPAFSNVNDARYRWYAYVNASGINGSTINAVTADTTSMTDKAYGLLLDAELKCNIGNALCYDTDYQYSGIGKTISKMLQYRAGQHLVERIKATNKPSMYIMTASDQLVMLRNSYRKEYENRLGWLATQQIIADTGCVVCKPGSTFGSIL